MISDLYLRCLISDDTANKTTTEEHTETEHMELEQNDDTQPDKSKPSTEEKIATPAENPPVESPNLTGTAVKNDAANLDKSDVNFYGSKKRLFPSCEESLVDVDNVTRLVALLFMGLVNKILLFLINV